MLKVAAFLFLFTFAAHAESPEANCGPHALIAKPDFTFAVKTAYRQVEGGFEITAKNDERYALHLAIRMEKLTGLESANGTAFVVAVPAGTEIVANTLRLKKPGTASYFNYHADAYLSHPAEIKPDKSFVYELPFQPGLAVTILQGYGGKFSHFNDLNRYALDFGMPRGTPILAARAGLVVASRSDMRWGGHDPALLGTTDGAGNFVMVLHDDGTVGNYFHMRCGSITLKSGDSVKAGDRLGETGSTGYSHPDYPHLHFVVRIPDEKNRFGRKTLPTLFRTGTGIIQLKEGQSYEK